MKTQSEAVNWIKYQNGSQKVGNGQCVALARKYVTFLGYPQPPLVNGAKDLWDVNWGPNFTKIPVSKPAQPGDIPIWNGNEGNGDGHIACLVNTIPDGFRSVDQNWGGQYPHFVNHTLKNVIGYVRPKFKEGDMLTEHGQDVLYRFYLGKNVPKSARKYVGKVTFDEESKRIRSLKSFNPKTIEAAKNGTLKAEDHLPKALRTVYVPPKQDDAQELKKGLYRVN